MFQDLNVFKMAHAMANHAGQRQSVVSRNIANADTPGYQARDVVSFSQALSEGGLDALTTSGGQSLNWTEYTPRSAADPNNNTVSLETEMLKAVEVMRQHERAVSIYRSALSVLRTSLGRGM